MGTTSVHVEIVHAPTLNFAMEQSGIPFLRDLTVRNAGAEPLEGTQIELQLLPGLGEPLRIPVPELPAGEAHSLGVIDYRLAPGRLREVVEAERARLRWSLSARGQALASGESDVEVLAFNEWPGSRAPLGLLACFVLPNHPVVATILQDVRRRLGEATGDDALDGYQRRSPRRVVEAVTALYQAVQGLGLSYAEIPASFEQQGQKIRLPDALLSGRLACCLDLTVLLAACMEQMGLRPLLVLVQGHAFPAVWLKDDRFPEGTVEDAARLRTLLALGDLLAFDSSTLVRSSTPPLEESARVAERYLADDAGFIAALDVRVLRDDRFRPLPLRAVAPPADSPEPPSPGRDRVREILEQARELPEPPPERPAPEPVASRFRRWQDRLLDLTLRNKLLNFRLDTQGALPLEVPDVARFEDLLASARRFDILPRPAGAEGDARDPKLVQARAPDAGLRQRRLEDLEAGVLHATLTEGELWTRVKHLDRTARTDLEEGGANTLFVAVGLLEWFESPDSAEPRLSPLFLYPVELRLDRRKRRFQLVRLEDDPIGNVTLAEKMRRDYDLPLDVLASPEVDESGVDVRGLLQAVRAAIQRMPRWEVREEAHVGLFTFTKFLMWKDLHDNEEAFLQNPLVRHIAEATSAAPPDTGEEILPEQVDVELSPAALPLVVDADSTQMAAVATAMTGRSMVLQGPPGTGKSQTITNVIASALAQGRTVLFVSEKMAALEVVYRRLKEAGLEDYCLELHSHKSNKKGIADSLMRVLQRKPDPTPPPWEERSAELGQLREGLNAYPRAIHQPRPLGMSCFDANARLLALRDAEELRFRLPRVEEWTESRFRQAQAEVAELAHRAEAVLPIEAHPWRACEANAWSARDQEGLEEALVETRRALSAADDTAKVLCDTFGVEVPGSTGTLEELAGIALVLVEGPAHPAALQEPSWPDISARGQAYAIARREAEATRRELGGRWSPGLFELDLDALHARFQRWAGAFFILALLLLWGARRVLRRLATGPLPGNAELARELGAARAWKARAPELEREREWIARVLPGLSPALLEPDGLEGLLRRGGALRERVGRLPESVRGAIQPAVQRAWSDPERATLRAQAEALDAALRRLSAAEDALTRRASVGTGRAWPARQDPRHRAGLREVVERWERSLPAYRPWCLFRQGCQRLRELELGPFVDALAGANVAASALPAAFEKGFLTQWVRAIRDSEPALRDFDGGTHHRRVERFARLDVEHLGLARRRVMQILDGRVPRGGLQVDGSEADLLAREAAKKTRHLPIRRLFERIPRLLPRLKPCLLMSPLSAAQYLPPTGRRFDLLVFDEASQIGTHDAIGAIARAEQVIVVGDSKQLPPTRFFTRGDDESAPLDENDVVELESVLEEAVAKRLPQQMLGWHYRSRHDALIDFSNRHYYGGRLHVFPAARQRVEELGVKWHPVPDGVYLGGQSGRGARTNPREAEALVALLVERLRRHPPGTRSFGVVTFSVAQQGLILDLLDEQRARAPELEAHFNPGLAEPVFVKNLENVQGDERDEILFSVCYARDAAGRLRMHFGPLSTSGGERRLNVAITRARLQLRVFSTLTYDQIDLTRTTAVGAGHLREFLRFAARAGGAAHEAGGGLRYPNAFARELAEALRELGHEVHAQVGSGGYRIDLAVVHPGQPGMYLLGVELDGLAYHSAPSARDRDRLRRQVLESLGWRLHRVWSHDWMTDRAAEIERLKKAIAAALEARVELPAEEAPEIPERPEEGGAPLARIASSLPPPQPVAPVEPYVPVELPESPGGTEAFFAARATSAVRERLLEVVRGEAPVHRELLARRVAASWGVQRLTERVRERVEAQLDALVRKGQVAMRGDFAWLAEVRIETFSRFRGPSAAGTVREVEHLPPEEVANAAGWLLAQSLSLSEDELRRETARLMGIARVGKNVLAAIDAGLVVLEQSGRCAREGERIVWKEAS